MGLLNEITLVLSRLPVERWLFRPPRQPDQWDRLEKFLARGEKREAIEERLDPTVPPAVSGHAPLRRSLVSDEALVAYQKRELGKELLLLEKHLQQGCRIPALTGEPCDCCGGKHAVVIEALALETYGMAADQIYQDIAEWARSIQLIASVEEIASGQHKYGPEAVKARGFRKEVMGTESLAALITPKQEITPMHARAEATRLATEEVLGSRVILTEPSERQPLPEEIRYFTDSEEQIEESMNRNGIRNGLNGAFKTAINRASGGR